MNNVTLGPLYAMQARINDAYGSAEALKDDHVRAARPLLEALTTEELYELATNCDEEMETDHCVYCAAHAIWVNRPDA